MKYFLVAIFLGAHSHVALTPYNNAAECKAAQANRETHAAANETKWSGLIKTVCVPQDRGYAVEFPNG